LATISVSVRHLYLPLGDLDLMHSQPHERIEWGFRQHAGDFLLSRRPKGAKKLLLQRTTRLVAEKEKYELFLADAPAMRRDTAAVWDFGNLDLPALVFFLF